MCEFCEVGHGRLKRVLVREIRAAQRPITHVIRHDLERGSERQRENVDPVTRALVCGERIVHVDSSEVPDDAERPVVHGSATDLPVMRVVDGAKGCVHVVEAGGHCSGAECAGHCKCKRSVEIRWQRGLQDEWGSIRAVA